MARRVLLLNDDYVENSRAEVVLKKIGFDVLGLGSEAGLHDKMISFRPDLVIASGSSAKVSAMSVGNKLKEGKGFAGQVILGFPKSSKLSPLDLLRVRMDRLLETPFAMDVLIRGICEVLALDAEAYLEKLKRLQWNESATEAQRVRGPSASSSESEVLEMTRIPTPGSEDASAPRSRMSPQERQERFDKAVAGLDINKSDTTFQRTAVRDKWAEVKKEWELASTDEQNELKKNFANALFEPENSGSAGRKKS